MIWSVRAREENIVFGVLVGYGALRHVATGRGAHGLYLNRAATELFVTNRLEGSVSVLDAYTGRVLKKWVITGHASPDMGNVTGGRQTVVERANHHRSSRLSNAVNARR